MLVHEFGHCTVCILLFFSPTFLSEISGLVYLGRSRSICGWLRVIDGLLVVFFDGESRSFLHPIAQRVMLDNMILDRISITG